MIKKIKGEMDKKFEQTTMRIIEKIDRIAYGIDDLRVEINNLRTRVEAYSEKADKYLLELQQYTHMP